MQTSETKVSVRRDGVKYIVELVYTMPNGDDSPSVPNTATQRMEKDDDEGEVPGLVCDSDKDIPELIDDFEEIEKNPIERGVVHHASFRDIDLLICETARADHALKEDEDDEDAPDLVFVPQTSTAPPEYRVETYLNRDITDARLAEPVQAALGHFRMFRVKYQRTMIQEAIRLHQASKEWFDSIDDPRAHPVFSKHPKMLEYVKEDCLPAFVKELNAICSDATEDFQETMIDGYPADIIVVPTHDPNLHRYALECPYQRCDYDEFYKWGSIAKSGNCMTTNRKYIRMPTVIEVIAMLAARS